MKKEELRQLDDMSAKIPADRDQQIFLVRHARPELPHGGRLYYGRTDYPLSEDGIECARRLGQALSAIEFDRLYCSDLERARHTAELIAPHKKNRIKADPSLREIFLGEWEGKSVDEVRERGAAYDVVAPPGGESFIELQKRAVPAIAAILDQSPSGRILIVAHSALIWSVMCHYFAFDLKELFFYPFDFCGVHLLHNSHGYMRMIRYNWNPRVIE